MLISSEYSNGCATSPHWYFPSTCSSAGHLALVGTDGKNSRLTLHLSVKQQRAHWSHGGSLSRRSARDIVTPVFAFLGLGSVMPAHSRDLRFDIRVDESVVVFNHTTKPIRRPVVCEPNKQILCCRANACYHKLALYTNTNNGYIKVVGSINLLMSPALQGEIDISIRLR